MRALMLAALVAAGPAFADAVLKVGTNELRLSASACSHEGIRAQIRPEFVDKFKAAVAHVNGTTFQACWIAVPNEGAVYVIFEDGDQQAYPMSAFKEAPNA